jgi:hypothetical protein
LPRNGGDGTLEVRSKVEDPLAAADLGGLRNARKDKGVGGGRKIKPLNS